MGLLELKNVSKGFGPRGARTEVLSGVHLDVAEGELVAIVGFSGTGKTTLISLIAGLEPADEGEVLLDGKAVAAPGPDRGVVFQNYSLLPWLTVFQNVELAVRQVEPGLGRSERAERVHHYVSLVNLADAHHKRPQELSGGMRQRVALARGLAMNPRVLLLDEPLGALDALTRAVLQGEIERIWAADRKTVVLITNDVDEAVLLADRIIPLKPGPPATLGPAFPVPLDRPRDRTALNHDPAFKAIRNKVTQYLLSVAPSTKGSAGRARVPLPDVQPRDLTRASRPFA